MEGPGTAPGPVGEGAGLFLPFFFHLRGRGLKVTPTQWLAVIEGLVRGLHGASLTGFYSMSRAILVRDETELDDFDLCFAEHFRGVPEAAAAIEGDVLRWLEDPIAPTPVDPEWRRIFEEIDVDALRAELERRLAEQTERHDGGSRWVGTGGTSPFGHGGWHPGGIRASGRRGHGTAVQVAAERHYREHRRDQVLDTRQLGVALKKLRALKRQGAADELDVDATIARTAKEGGELELVFRPPRANDLELLLAFDVGGSMDPYRRLVDRLFSAAHGARHFKRFDHVYFHNCVYEAVYADAAFGAPIPLHELLRVHGPETRLVLVGDAHMYPGELTQRWGAIHWSDHNEEPGIVHLERLAAHFRRAAWLNPMDERWWNAPSIRLIGRLFDMYPLTVAGVERLALDLSG